MINRNVFLMLVLSLALAGCTTLKKVTGQTNDTILPGSREDVLPPDQQTARDPAVIGNQPAPGGAIQQQGLAQPGMPQQPPQAQKGDLLPTNNGTVVACDPLVQTCPGMEPKAKPKLAAKGTAPAGKVIVPAKTKTAKPVTAKATTPPAAGDATAQTPGAPAVETVGTDPMKPVATPVKKKVKKKKKLVVDPNATGAAATDATQAPPPVVPPDAQPSQ